MRTICTKVYKFNELNEEAKNKAIENFRDTQDFYYVEANEYEFTSAGEMI